MQIELNTIQKYYKIGKNKLHILKSLNLEIVKGEFLMIMGKSGSGKTTLLNIIGLLDKIDDGNYTFGNEDVSHLSERKRSEYRASHIGFIFQQFNLIETLNVFQNLEVPTLYSKPINKDTGNKLTKKEIELLIKEQLRQVGLLDKIKSFPNHLSGGQKQRVAIARALMNDPEVILADEPTGALDSETGEDIMNLLTNLNKRGKTIIMVTHDQDLIKYASRVVILKDGVFVSEV